MSVLLLNNNRQLLSPIVENLEAFNIVLRNVDKSTPAELKMFSDIERN